MSHIKTCLVSFAIFVLSATSLGAKTVDVIWNDEIVPIGMLEPVLKAKDYEINIIPVQNFNLREALNRNADLVVILGGRQSVTELHKNPFFFDEISMIRSRASRQMPTLGVCLGAQMIALAFGGNVVRGPQAEQGWIEMLEGDDKIEPFVANLIKSKTKVFASHEDIIELPPDAQGMARSDLYNHIFAIGGRTVAIQFHPEATPEIMHKWLTLFGRSEDAVAKAHEENQVQHQANKAAIEKFLMDTIDYLERPNE